MPIAKASFREERSGRDVKARVVTVGPSGGWEITILSTTESGGGRGLGTVDTAVNILDPITEIESDPFPSRQLIRTNGSGTLLQLMVAYPIAGTLSTPPQVQVFGRALADIELGTGSDSLGENDRERFMRIKSRSGLTSIVMTDEGNAVRNAGAVPSSEAFKYTFPDIDTQTCDITGCDEILIGVVVAGVVTTGSIDDARLLCKLI